MSNSFTKQRSQIPRPKVCKTKDEPPQTGGVFLVEPVTQQIFGGDIATWVFDACKASLPQNEEVIVTVQILSGPFQLDNVNNPRNCEGQSGSADGPTDDGPSQTVLQFTATWSDGSFTTRVVTIDTLD